MSASGAIRRESEAAGEEWQGDESCCWVHCCGLQRRWSCAASLQPLYSKLLRMTRGKLQRYWYLLQDNCLSMPIIFYELLIRDTKIYRFQKCTFLPHLMIDGSVIEKYLKSKDRLGSGFIYNFYTFYQSILCFYYVHYSIHFIKLWQWYCTVSSSTVTAAK